MCCISLKYTEHICMTKTWSLIQMADELTSLLLLICRFRAPALPYVGRVDNVWLSNELSVKVSIGSLLLHTHTNIQTDKLFYGSLDFVRDNPGESVPEETFTHSHLLWLQSMAYSLFNLRASLFSQSLSKFSLVYLLAWHPPFYTPYISSSSHCLLFAAHVHTIATCFAVVPRF